MRPASPPLGDARPARAAAACRDHQVRDERHHERGHVQGRAIVAAATSPALVEHQVRQLLGPRSPAPRSLAALVIGAPGAQSIETWDLTTGKRLGRFAVRTTRQRPCARAQLLGETLLVDTGACRTPRVDVTERFEELVGTGAAATEAGALLATPQGRRIAVVGGDRPRAALDLQPVFLADHRWAFVATRGDTVVIQDVASGVVERRIATGAQVEPAEVAAGADDLGHLVLVFGGTTPRAGSLMVIDTASGAVRSIPAPEP